MGQAPPRPQTSNVAPTSQDLLFPFTKHTLMISFHYISTVTFHILKGIWDDSHEVQAYLRLGTIAILLWRRVGRGGDHERQLPHRTAHILVLLRTVWGCSHTFIDGQVSSIPNGLKTALAAVTDIDKPLWQGFWSKVKKLWCLCIWHSLNPDATTNYTTTTLNP